MEKDTRDLRGQVFPARRRQGKLTQRGRMMHIVKGILVIILILVLVVVGLYIANILTSSSPEEAVIYHLIVYDNSTDEILEEWESHDIRVYEEGNYVVFINNADNGYFYKKRLLNDKNQIRYTLEERREEK